MNNNRGFTLIELVIVVAIVGILAAVVLPLARWSVKRQQEYELQQSLRILREAIDRYHDLALAGAIEVLPGGTGYPEDLDVLVEGVELVGEIPSPVPGVADGYSASGFGLTGGYAGAAQQQQSGGSGMPLGAVGGDAAAQRNALQGGVNETIQQLQENAGGPGGASSGGLGTFSLNSSVGQSGGRGGQGEGATRQGGINMPAFGTPTVADRRGGGRGSAGVGADVTKIVFLRRLPVDPITGSSDWGLRCYGDSIEDRSWCGRNVFDVYSKALGRAIDGRPYREW